MTASSRSPVNDGPPTAASVERLTRQLEAAAPHERLALLLTLASGVSSCDARRALALAQEADELAARANDTAAHAEALYLQGRCASLLLDHAHALDLYDRALDAFEAARNEVAVAKTLRAISFVHDALGDFSRALDYQFRALA